ncbi:MAG: hypothetical protein J6R50_02780 [Alistipes sp.]|nr:hypothetical protein [Alistipes sp.]
MYSISHQLYLEVWGRLMSAIGRKEYFSGSVTCIVEDTECRLTCTLIVVRNHDRESEGRMAEIEKIIPVWWEFHTTIGGQELLNDFSFRELLYIAL